MKKKSNKGNVNLKEILVTLRAERNEIKERYDEIELKIRTVEDLLAEFGNISSRVKDVDYEDEPQVAVRGGDVDEGALTGGTVKEALIYIAHGNKGVLEVQEAKALLVQAGRFPDEQEAGKKIGPVLSQAKEFGKTKQRGKWKLSKGI